MEKGGGGIFKKNKNKKELSSLPEGSGCVHWRESYASFIMPVPKIRFR